MNRLTDDRTAEGIKRICDGRLAEGVNPETIKSDLRYVKLAEYEQTGYEPADLVKAVGGCVGFLSLVEEGLQESKWISVEDRMPECGVNVLVITNYGEFAIAQRRDNSAVHWADEWMLQYEPGDTDVWTDYQHGTITHWMPLPEPPKEVQDDE